MVSFCIGKPQKTTGFVTGVQTGGASSFGDKFTIFSDQSGEAKEVEHETIRVKFQTREFKPFYSIGGYDDDPEEGRSRES